MSEGGRDPIIIPVGFILDEASLEAVIKEAERRFSQSLGSAYDGMAPSYAPSTSGGGGDAGSSYVAKYEELAARWVPNTSSESFSKRFEDIDTFISRFSKRFDEISGGIEQSRSLLELARSFEEKTQQSPQQFTQIRPYPEPSEERQKIIDEVAALSMFDTSGKNKYVEEVTWEYFTKWMTNISGAAGAFQQVMPPPLERKIGIETETEQFRNTALIAMNEEARVIFSDIAEKIGGEEFRDSLFDREIMKEFKGLTGTVTESGGPRLNLVFGIDKLEQTSVEAAEEVSKVFQEQLFKAMRSDDRMFLELTGAVSEMLAEGFTRKSIDPENMFNPNTPRVDVGATIVTKSGDQWQQSHSDTVDVFSWNAEALKRIDEQAAKRAKRKKKDIFKGKPPLFGNIDPDTGLYEQDAVQTEYVKNETAILEKLIAQIHDFSEKGGSVTDVDENAQQGKRRSLKWKKGEISSRIWTTIAERDRALNEREAIENLIMSPEGLDVAIEVFGVDKVSKAAQSLQRSWDDRSHILAPYRYSTFDLVAEAGEKWLLERRALESLPPTTGGQAEYPGIGRFSFDEIGEFTPTPEAEDMTYVPPKVKKRLSKAGVERKYARMVKAFEEREKEQEDLRVLRPIIGLTEKERLRIERDKEFLPGELGDMTLETYGMARQKLDDMVEQVANDRFMKVTGFTFEKMARNLERSLASYGSSDEIEDRRLASAAISETDTLQEMLDVLSLVRTTVQRIDPLGWTISPKGIDKNRAGNQTIILGDETVNRIAEATAQRLSQPWQQTVGGGYTPDAEGGRIKGKKRQPSTEIGDVVRYMQDELE